MSTIAGDVVNYNLKSGKRDRIELEARGTVAGGAGAISLPLTFQDDPGITITRGGSAGLYNVTFPVPVDAQAMGFVQVVSAAGTVKGAYWTLFNPAAGTASFQVVDATGTAADPAAGNSVAIQLFLSTRKDF